MPLTNADFLAPKGEIEAGLFPQDSASTLAARIDEYLAQATAIVGDLDPALDAGDVDAAIAHLVYFRLYDAILIRLANTPDTSIADEGSIRFSAAQINIFENKRGEHQIAYDALVAGTVVAPGTGEAAPTSSARTIFRFL
jgi:hypothetical protein